MLDQLASMGAPEIIVAMRRQLNFRYAQPGGGTSYQHLGACVQLNAGDKLPPETLCRSARDSFPHHAPLRRDDALSDKSAPEVASARSTRITRCSILRRASRFESVSAIRDQGFFMSTATIR